MAMLRGNPARRRTRKVTAAKKIKAEKTGGSHAAGM
jgi:hypothetical protein